MDYVVFGTGYGATLMLLGWALRTFGPVLRYRQDSEGPAGADLLMARLSWRRFSSALGAVVATAGIALILITFILILVNPGNTVGSRIAWACFVLVLITVAAWLWIYVGRYGIYGLLPERPEPATVFRSPRPTPEAARPSPKSPPVAVSHARIADDTPHDFADDVEEYVEDDEDWYDDEYDDEQESRFAKFELHHPDEMEETAAYDPIHDKDEPELAESDEASLRSPQEAEPDEQLFEAGEERVERESEDDESIVVPDEPMENDGLIVVAEEPIDAPKEAPEPIPAEHADVDAEADTSADDVEDVEVADVSNDRDDKNPMILQDTPEGRAEALRRIEAWQPDVPEAEVDNDVSPGIDRDEES